MPNGKMSSRKNWRNIFNENDIICKTANFCFFFFPVFTGHMIRSAGTGWTYLAGIMQNSPRNSSNVEQVILKFWFHSSVNSPTTTSQTSLKHWYAHIHGACLCSIAPIKRLCCLGLATVAASAAVTMGINLPKFRTNVRGENTCFVAKHHSM